MHQEKSRFVDFYNNYWKYYRQLEDELIVTRKYVDFSKGNLYTYSMEFLKLYQAVCSEIDVVGKVMALNINEQFNTENSNIQKWWYIIHDSYHITDGPQSGMNESDEVKSYKIYDYSCGIFCGMELQPWKNYFIECYKNTRGNVCYKLEEGSTTPSWWKNYNEVKHNRISAVKNQAEMNFEKANLKNVVLAFSALYILERGYLDTIGNKTEIATFTDYSELFTGRRQLTLGQIEAVYKHI